jgi:aminoglycoside phosphotransferase family enzyme
VEKPVIFDCIEFSEHFRHNDVLSELAFLAMDLERYGRADFKEVLIRKYQEVFPCFPKREDEIIFQYYLLYRASVRLKINALQLKEKWEEGEVNNEEEVHQIRSLAKLCQQYFERLKTTV